ncbi:hypothetical protein ABZP36_006306 [Zizania latifolia]
MAAASLRRATIVTGAGDETLRFWNIFPSMKTQNLNLTNQPIVSSLTVTVVVLVDKKGNILPSPA